MERLKIRIFNTCVISILLYGCESWMFTKTIVKKIRGFVSNYYYVLSKQTTTEIKKDSSSKRSIDSFHEAMNAIDIIKMIEKRRWSWLGHVLRMQPDQNPRKALTLLFDMPDKKGSILAHLPIDIANESSACLAASDRTAWKKRFLDSQYISLMQCL